MRAIASTPVRTPYPGVDGLVLDALDRLWVAEHPGMVHLPWLDRGPLPGRSELLAVGERSLAVHRRNEFGEESVEVWSVYAPGRR